MFFEDEKDIIKEGADIHIDEDGTVTWEDVLNDEEDIEVLDETSKNVSQQNIQQEDELDLVREPEDEINDSELMEILNQPQEKTSEQEIQEGEDFDIDAQLANVVLEQNNSQQEDTIPRKNEKKQPSSSSPLLLAVLFGVLVVVVIYYGMQYFQGNSAINQASKDELDAAPSIQQDMDNMTPEELEQRQAQEETIPVVNEEEANEIKPLEDAQSEKTQEKKQVIAVVPTGRPNPFMPISKYARTSIPEAHLLYDKTGIPKPPETYGIKEEETVQLMTIAVSGVMYDDVKPSAIITYNDNDYFVQKGDRLDNYRIVDISRNSVMIALGKNVYRANVGEEFKITSKFDGSAQFIPQQQGGGRQYYSVSNQANGTEKDPSKLRYVSEDEIKINAK